MSAFSDMLIFLRKREGYSQQELADKLSFCGNAISRSAVSMYESGKREPNYETLEQIADFFNVNMSTLLGESDIKIEPTYSELSETKQALLKVIENMTDEQAEAILKIMGK